MPVTAPGRSSSPGVRLGLGQEARREQRGDDADRGVDQQRQPPAVDVERRRCCRGRSASRRAAGRRRHRRRTSRRTPRRRGCGPGPAGNVVAISASAAGEASAAPRPWRPRAASSSPSLVARPPSSEATPKIDQADHEDLAAAVEVTEAATEQQQAAEGERVAGDDPAQVGVGDVEVGLDVGERDVHDRAVEHHHELRDGDEHERPAEVLAHLPVSVFSATARVGSGGVGHGDLFCRVGGMSVSRAAGGGRQDDLVDHAGDQRPGSGGSPRRKKRCRTIPARAGASRSRSTSARISPRSLRALEQIAREAADLGADHVAAERLGELRVAGDRGEDGSRTRSTSGLSVRPPVAAERADQVAAQGAGVGRGGRGPFWWWCRASMTRLTLPFQRR